MKMPLKFFLQSLLIIFVALLLVYFSPVSDEIFRQKFLTAYQVLPPPLPDSLFFAGEKVPLDQFDVRERVERELMVNTFWQSQTLLLLKRSTRWFPIMDSILQKNGVPTDFKYLASAESGLINVVSPAGAVGYWQFLKSTGKKYGLQVDDEIDERYDVEKSTEAACKYFLNAYDELHSWSLVAASYNMGLDGVENQIEKQKVNSYYDLLLNDETFRYVARIIAMKEILTNPDNYGFHIRRKDLYAPFQYSQVCIDSSVKDLAEFALSQNINYKKLKLLNPWLRQNTITNKSGKSYVVKILNGDYTGTMSE